MKSATVTLFIAIAITTLTATSRAAGLAGVPLPVPPPAGIGAASAAAIEPVAIPRHTTSDTASAPAMERSVSRDERKSSAGVEEPLPGGKGGVVVSVPKNPNEATRSVLSGAHDVVSAIASIPGIIVGALTGK